MSGDVQPRKRKDKRKKQRDSIDRRSEGDLSFLRRSSIQEDDESSHGVHITKMGSDDVHLHVHQDHGTGGHWCAKIFFFTLLAVLFGLISLIIMENRGISDLDTPLSESRFSNYFDGWVDEQPESHDEHDAVQASLEDHNEHDEPFEEEEAISEGDDEDEDDHEDDDHADDEDEDNEEDEVHGDQDDDNENDDDNDNDDDDNDNDDDDDDEVDQATKEEETQEDVDRTIEKDDDDDDDDNNDDEDENNNDDDEDADNNENDDEEEENSTLEAGEPGVETTENDEDDDDDNDNDDNDDEDDDKKSIEENIASVKLKKLTAQLDEEDDEDDNDKADDDDDDDDDDNNDNDGDDDDQNDEANTKEESKNSADPFDEDDDDDDDDDGTFELFDNVVDNDAEELLLLQKKAAAAMPVSEAAASEENEEIEAAEDKPSWLSSLAVKLGVGVALALVARLLLLRKNPNTNDEAPNEAMMKRRLTIAGPEDKFPEDVDTPLLPTDEFSEDEEIIEEEIIEFLEEEVEEEVEEEEDEEEDIEVDDDGVEIERSGKYSPETFEELNAMYREHTAPSASSHPTATQQEQQPHTPEYTPEITKMTSKSKESLQNNSSIANKSVGSQKPPPIFVAPPPPRPPPPSSSQPPTMAQPVPTLRRDEIAKVTSTNANNSKLTISPISKTTTTTTTEAAATTPGVQTSPSQGRKRTVTHDIDYKPDDADDHNYNDDDNDDENYDSDDMDEEDEVDDDEDMDISDIDDISDVDDTDLMNRLEAKYGKLPATPSSATKEFESDEDPDDPTWTQIKHKETVDSGGAQAFDEDDDSFEAQLHRARAELARENFAGAFRIFSKLAETYPDQPQAFFGQCQAFYEYIKTRNVPEYRNDALYACKRFLAFGRDIIVRDHYRSVAEIALEIIEDLGVLHQAEEIYENLLNIFPNDLDYMKRYALYLTKSGKLVNAKILLRRILQSSPGDGLALAHYGLVLLELSGNNNTNNEAIRYLQRGIDTNEKGAQVAFLYIKLGEAYQRLGKVTESQKVYERARDLKLIASVMQRAIYFVPDLRAKPFWSIEDTGIGISLNSMRSHWRAIREEGIRAMKIAGYFENESENLRDSGTWQLLDLWAQGRKNERNCKQAPLTCALIAEIPAVRSCRRGQVKFSMMLPSTHIWPHCGPTNARLRGHLGLVVPDGSEIRVGNETRSWTEGEFLIFDDSFEHEVWQNGDTYRLVLIVDMWHPDLSEDQRQNLTPL